MSSYFHRQIIGRSISKYTTITYVCSKINFKIVCYVLVKNTFIKIITQFVDNYSMWICPSTYFGHMHCNEKLCRIITHSNTLFSLFHCQMQSSFINWKLLVNNTCININNILSSVCYNFYTHNKKDCYLRTVCLNLLHSYTM